MILRHQLAVPQRQQPRRPELNWADRALLATLLAVLPKARRHGLRLLVTPDTIVRWHRDIVRRRWAARSMRGKTGRPATCRHIKALVLRLAQENPERGYRRATENWPAWESRSRRRSYGRSSRPPCPKTDSRRRHDQRISLDRVTWTRFRYAQADALGPVALRQRSATAAASVRDPRVAALGWAVAGRLVSC